MFKNIAHIEYHGELTCKLRDTLRSVIQKVILSISSHEKLKLNTTLTSKVKGTEATTLKELQSNIPTAGDTASGPNEISYSIIRELPGVAMATLLALYNAIWMQGDGKRRSSSRF